METTPTVLLVDDERTTLHPLAGLLKREGYRVLTAETFEQGRDLLRAAKPDLVIVDVRLGDFNGLQLVAMSPTRIPAIVVTGFADVALEREARQLGAEFLVKPIELEELLSLVARQLHAAKPPAPVRRWRRKSLNAKPLISVAGAPVLVHDASHGGMRLEIDNFEEELPATLPATLPQSEGVMHLSVVWKVRLEENRWLFGAELSDREESAASAWRQLVDSL